MAFDLHQAGVSYNGLRGLLQTAEEDGFVVVFNDPEVGNTNRSSQHAYFSDQVDSTETDLLCSTMDDFVVISMANKQNDDLLLTSNNNEFNVYFCNSNTDKSSQPTAALMDAINIQRSIEDENMPGFLYFPSLEGDSNSLSTTLNRTSCPVLNSLTMSESGKEINTNEQIQRFMLQDYDSIESDEDRSNRDATRPVSENYQTLEVHTDDELSIQPPLQGGLQANAFISKDPLRRSLPLPSLPTRQFQKPDNYKIQDNTEDFYEEIEVGSQVPVSKALKGTPPMKPPRLNNLLNAQHSDISNDPFENAKKVNEIIAQCKAGVSNDVRKTLSASLIKNLERSDIVSAKYKIAVCKDKESPRWQGDELAPIYNYPIEPQLSSFGSLVTQESVLETPYESVESIMDVILELPPLPVKISQNEAKRREIVRRFINDENVYVQALEKIKKFDIHISDKLNLNDIKTVVDKLTPIIAWHQYLRSTLQTHISQWDTSQSIGDALHLLFANVTPLNVYKDYIAKMGLAFVLINGLESLSEKPLCGSLMTKRTQTENAELPLFLAKPLHRYQEYIRFVLELLSQTDNGHPDYINIQRSLTVIEIFTEQLNASCCRMKQMHEVKCLAQHFTTPLINDKYKDLPGKYCYKSSVTDLIMGDKGEVVQGNPRELIIFNDRVMCVQEVDDDSIKDKKETRFRVKWDSPISHISLVKINTSSLSTSNESECVDLIHDFNVLFEISSKVKTLRGSYGDLNLPVDTIQRSIRNTLKSYTSDISKTTRKRLRLRIGTPDSDQFFPLFEFENNRKKLHWCQELCKAQLKHTYLQNPYWICVTDIDSSIPTSLLCSAILINEFSMDSEKDGMPMCGVEVQTNKIPVKSDSVDTFPNIVNAIGPLSDLWTVCHKGKHNYCICVLSFNSSPNTKRKTFKISDRMQPHCIEYASSHFDTVVLIGTVCGKILVFDIPSEKMLHQFNFGKTITLLRYVCDRLLVGFADGSLLTYERHTGSAWAFTDPDPRPRVLGNTAVTCAEEASGEIWVPCGHQLFVYNLKTMALTAHCEVTTKKNHSVTNIAICGSVFLITYHKSPMICFYHRESKVFIHEMSIVDQVQAALKVESSKGKKLGKIGSNSDIYVSACRRILSDVWLGTNKGVLVRMHLPNQGGIPIFERLVIMATFDHSGPINFIQSVNISTSACQAPDLRPEEEDHGREEGPEFAYDLVTNSKAIETLDDRNQPQSPVFTVSTDSETPTGKSQNKRKWTLSGGFQALKQKAKIKKGKSPTVNTLETLSPQPVDCLDSSIEDQPFSLIGSINRAVPNNVFVVTGSQGGTDHITIRSSRKTQLKTWWLQFENNIHSN